jgi:hypothetical protein
MDYLVQTEDANGTDISVADINGSQLDIDHLLSTANTSGNLNQNKKIWALVIFGPISQQ